MDSRRIPRISVYLCLEPMEYKHGFAEMRELQIWIPGGRTAKGWIVWLVWDSPHYPALGGQAQGLRCQSSPRDNMICPGQPIFSWPWRPGALHLTEFHTSLYISASNLWNRNRDLQKCVELRLDSRRKARPNLDNMVCLAQTIFSCLERPGPRPEESEQRKEIIWFVPDKPYNPASGGLAPELFQRNSTHPCTSLHGVHRIHLEICREVWNSSREISDPHCARLRDSSSSSYERTPKRS